MSAALINRQIEPESDALAIPAHARESSTTALLISVIAEAARDPQVDAAKMRELWELKQSIDAQEAEIAFNQSMMAAQAEMRPVLRDAVNPHTSSRYASLETIDRKIRPIYIKHGFALSFNSRPSEDGMLTVSCLCMHCAGHSKPYELSGPLDSAGARGGANKTGIQATGSSVAYLRRYLECLIFNIILTAEDDDGSLTETVSQEQLNQIVDLILAAEMDQRAKGLFCKFMGVERVDDIPARDYQKAVAALQAKYRQVKGTK